MSHFSRRTFLRALGGAGLALSAGPTGLLRALADTPGGSDEFFLLIHAAGGWDVTLWADPRNERRGLVEPPSTDFLDASQLRLWTPAPLDADSDSFQLVRPAGSNLVFGPGIGNLSQLYDRLTLFNGLAVNTVSHPDGTYFGATGRHLAGGRAVASSIDTILANEFGVSQLLPSVSVSFPSALVGDAIDRRATPLALGAVGTLSKSLTRSNLYTYASDRDAVSALLTEEARDLAREAWDPSMLTGMADQFEALRRILGGTLASVFSATALQTAHPEFDVRGRYFGGSAVNFAFAVEAFRRNVVRCMAFALSGFDTHSTNYRNQGGIQQEMFDLIAALVRQLDMTQHPTIPGDRLSDHTHILVFSEFCRTPQINLTNGRDHYPNGSALVISPRFRGNTVHGATDVDQLLPGTMDLFADGMRAPGPPDVLATLLAAVGVDPRKYLRDGDVIRAVLRG